MADCGLRWIAALAGLGRIADCTSGPLHCKDASFSGARRPAQCAQRAQRALSAAQNRRMPELPHGADPGIRRCRAKNAVPLGAWCRCSGAAPGFRRLRA
eukprot:12858844-Alexandrium_andersonii.AAC.1